MKKKIKNPITFSAKAQCIYIVKSFSAYTASAVAALRSLRQSSSGSWQFWGSDLEKHNHLSLIWSINFNNLSKDFLTNFLNNTNSFIKYKAFICKKEQLNRNYG